MTVDGKRQGPAQKEESDLEPVWPGERFSCIFCGACCRSVFSPDWLKFLTDHGLEPDANGDCPRLGKDRKCIDHENRFNPCRSFPFTMKTSGEKNIYFLAFHRGCSGFGQGDKIDIEAVVKELVGLANAEFGRTFRIERIDIDEDQPVMITLSRSDK